MRVLLLVMSFGAGLAGFAVLGASRSAMHEVEAFLLFTVAAVLLSGAAIVEAVNLSARQIIAAIEKARPQIVPPAAEWKDPRPSFPPPPSFEPDPPPVPAPAFETSLDPKEPSPVELSSPEDQAGDLYDLARDFAKAGDKNSAINTLRDLVEKFPRTQAAEKARRMINRKS